MTTSKSKSTNPDHSKPIAGIIILQWLTYAFWGWALLAINWLIFIVMFSFLAHQDQTDAVPYAIAAVMVLLPISVICDYFYGKHDMPKKSGIAMIVMVIHAVIFALFAIGSLIFMVFHILQIFVSTTASIEMSISWAVSFLISAKLYGLMLLRTINPFPKINMKKVYPLTMIVVLIGFLIAAFVGPVSKSLLTRDDRLISTNLSAVVDAIQTYAILNDKLPNSLSGITLSASGAEDIVKRGLVAYQIDQSEVEGTLHYQLCVTYKEKDTSGYDVAQSVFDDEYPPYLDTTNHPEGRVCYKIGVDVSELKMLKYR